MSVNINDPWFNFPGSVKLEDKKIIFVGEVAGCKTESTSVTFDVAAQIVKIDATLDRKSFKFKISDLLENGVDNNRYRYQHVYPMNFDIEDGIITIEFGYCYTEDIDVNPLSEKAKLERAKEKLSEFSTGVPR